MNKENQTQNDFDVHLFGDIKEGIGSSGTRTEGETDFEDTFPYEDPSDDLVDLPFTAPLILPMTQWLKLPISNDVFSSYSTSGISSKSVSFKPFVLKPSKMYMLDVTLESVGKEVGRSQLYLSVNEMSQKMTCQVQPSYGTEFPGLPAGGSLHLDSSISIIHQQVVLMQSILDNCSSYQLIGFAFKYSTHLRTLPEPQFSLAVLIAVFCAPCSEKLCSELISWFMFLAFL
ncbi:polycystin-1-like protein 1 [Hyperolius riggenbachi]|uniref:polycystin-1-like protein 1 n=1 Tax=Hyperolius riggenbachi TaxID=752182 RepID=UPI0035A319D3